MVKEMEYEGEVRYDPRIKRVRGDREKPTDYLNLPNDLVPVPRDSKGRLLAGYPPRHKKNRIHRIRLKRPTQQEIDLYGVPLDNDQVISELGLVSTERKGPEFSALSIMEKYRALPDGPLHFIEDWFGILTTPFFNDCPPEGYDGPMPLWSKQVEVLRKLFIHKKVAVKSGHGIGKTFIAGLAALTLGYLYPSIVITTAPTFRQVQKMVWGEIHAIHARATRFLEEKKMSLGGKLNLTELNLGPKWYIMGFSTDNPDSFQGFHEEIVFLIIDEACGVPNGIYEAAEGILTSEKSYVLLIGNPTDPTSEFAKKFEPGSEFATETLSCYDSPNVKNNRNVYPKLVSCEWPNKKKKQWGEDSPMFKVRVLGEFPSEREDALIPYKYIQEAMERNHPIPDEKDPIVSYGFDIARYGDATSVLGSRHQSGRFRIRFESIGRATTKTTGQAVGWRMMNGNIPGALTAPVNVDDIGVGGGVTDMLIEQGIPCNGVNVSEAPMQADMAWERPELFLNKRSQYYWRVRQLFMDGKVDINDEELARDLSRIRYEYTSSGKIKMIAKDEFRKEYGYSPDKADTFMLSCAYEEAYSTRDFARWMV